MPAALVNTPSTDPGDLPELPPLPTWTAVGDALRRRRERLRLSQMAVAREAGLSDATVCRIERGGGPWSAKALDACEAALTRLEQRHRARVARWQRLASLPALPPEEDLPPVPP